MTRLRPAKLDFGEVIRRVPWGEHLAAAILGVHASTSKLVVSCIGG